jgi:hypothetical protein
MDKYKKNELLEISYHNYPKEIKPIWGIWFWERKWTTEQQTLAISPMMTMILLWRLLCKEEEIAVIRKSKEG